MMETLWHDLRYGARMLRKKPGFTLIAIITLALGIGANTAIFSVINAVLLRPLPYKEPERLVHVFRNQPGVFRAPISRPVFFDWQSQQRVFSEIAAYSSETFNLTGGAEAERLNGSPVTDEFWPLFDMAPARGRFFTRSDDQAGGNPVAVIGYGLWQRRFGGDSNAVGKTLTLNGEAYTVVGIAPPQFQFPRGVEVWTPARLAQSSRPRGNNYLSVIARLKEGVDETQARAQMNQVAAVLAEQYPAQESNLTVSLSPLPEDEVRNIRPALWILLGAVVFVLLIACANVATLLLARAATRQKEFAIRQALGASRRRVTQQLLTESVLLALLGGALGVLLAMWGVDVLVSFAPGNIPRVKEISLDASVFGFTLVISLLTGIIFGLAPAWQSAGRALNQALKKDARGATGSAYQAMLRRVFIVTDIALSLVLLVSAGLLVTSLRRLLSTDPGFNPNNLLTADISFPRRPASAYAHGNAGEEQRKQEIVNFLNEAQQRVAALAGVQSVGLISDLPVIGTDGMNGNFKVDGQPDRNWADAPNAEWRLITPDYFSAMGIPLVKGRLFSQGETRSGPFSIMINDVLAHRFFDDSNPIGEHLRMLDGEPHEIIGVVGAARQMGLNLPPEPEIYLSYQQMGFGEEATLVVRTANDPTGIAESVRRVIREVNMDVPVFRTETMAQVLSNSTSSQRFNTILMTLFAAVALVMAAIGLYGLVSYSVTQRTHEIGVRMALGAQPRDVLKLVVTQGLVLAVIGVTVGSIAAFGLTRLMTGLLFGISPTDPVVFTEIALLLLGVALAASYLPARRAARVDPMEALRYE